MQTDITVTTYQLHDLAEYINWIYFFHAWGFQPRFATVSDIHGCPACQEGWVSRFDETDRAKAREAIKLYRDARQLLNELDGR